MSNKIKILLVEDNPGDARLVEEMLLRAEARRFDLDSVGTLAVAFEKMNHSNYDIMLLDLGLPDSQGIETIDRVRSLASNMPIVILTGLADEDVGIQAVEQGAQDFLVKWETNEAGLARTIRYAIERKQAEEALRQSEKRYHVLFEGMLGTCAIIEVTGDNHGSPCEFRYFDVNRAFEEISAKKREEVIGRTVAEVFPASTQDWFDAAGRVALTGESARFIYYSPDLDRVFDYSIYNPEPGKIAVIGWDMTEQIKASKALKESQERLDLAVSGANLGLWDWDIKTGQVVLSDRAFEILGYGIDEIDTDIKALIGLIHPDDIIRVQDKVTNHLQDEIPALDIEARIMFKSGERRWIQMSGRVVERDVDRRPIRAVGIFRDIDEIMQAQTALRRSEERYRQIVEISGEGIIMIDIDDKTTFVNKQLTDMLGYAEEEMLGRSVYEFMDEEGKMVARGHIERRKMGIREQYDFRFRKKDGDFLWTIISTAPLNDDAGNYLGSLKMVMDINERKTSEIRDRARFALINKLRSAKTIDECLAFAAKTIFDSSLFERAAFMYFDEERNVVNFGYYGLDKARANAVRRNKMPEQALLDKIMQLKFRISKSYFVPQGAIAGAAGGPLDLSDNSGNEKQLWKAGDIMIMPLVKFGNDKYDGLVTVAYARGGQRPPLHEIILRLEEIADMVAIRTREIRHTEELVQERHALAEKNVALKEIMSVIEAEKMEIRQQIAGMIDQVLKPSLSRLIRRDGSVNKTYFDLLRYNLDELSVATGGALHISSKLSPREMEICAMIKNGASSKDIAEALDIALVTVQKHREVIRKKLGLTNKNVNLTTHLRNM